MINKKFIVRDNASEEIISQYIWYENAKTGLGEEFLQELDETYKYIQHYPDGFEQKYKTFRFIKTKRFPFVIIYEVFDDAIVIFLAQNTRKNDKNLKELLDKE